MTAVHAPAAPAAGRRTALLHRRTAGSQSLSAAAAALALVAAATTPVLVAAGPLNFDIHSNLQSFQPLVTNIILGDSVTFFFDGTRHIYQTANATSCEYNGGFDTGQQESNAANLTVVPTKAGTYYFASANAVNCAAGQRGALIVRPASATATSTFIPFSPVSTPTGIFNAAPALRTGPAAPRTALASVLAAVSAALLL